MPLPTPPLGRASNWLLGQVAGFNTLTHTYSVTAGGHLLRGVPRLLSSPGDATSLPVDTLVAMHRELGEWVIAGVINRAAGSRPELSPTVISEITPGVALESVCSPDDIGDARAPNAPTDLNSDDWVHHGLEGQLIGVLANGVVEMKSSPLAQIRTFQDNNLVQIISHLFKHITAMGDSEVSVTDDGKVSYAWKGASHRKEVDAKAWTMHLTVGAQKSGHLFSFRVTRPGDSGDLAEIAIGADGRLHLSGEALHLTTGTSGTSTEVHPNDHRRNVGGSSWSVTRNDENSVISGGQNIEISKQQSIVAGSRRDTLTGSSSQFIGGTDRVKVMGETPPKPGSRAGSYEFVNGGLEVVIGNPFSGGIASSMASGNWITYNGGLNFVVVSAFAKSTPPAGGFNVVSSMPGSVNLGVDGTVIPKPDGTHEVIPVVGPYSLMKYEPFEQMMNMFFNMIDKHQHQSTGPTSITTPPVPILPGSMAKTFMPLIKSLRVKVGL